MFYLYKIAGEDQRFLVTDNKRSQYISSMLQLPNAVSVIKAGNGWNTRYEDDSDCGTFIGEFEDPTEFIQQHPELLI